jgi:hypothetical protein
MDPCLIAEFELEEFQTKQWDCKLMLKPSLDDTIPDVDLLNFITSPVGISNMGSSEFPSGYLYRFPSCYNGVDDWKKIKSDIYNCENKCGFKLANNEQRSNALGHGWRLICNRGMIYVEPDPKGNIKLKRKYEVEKLYQEGIGKTTVYQSHRAESRGREGLKMSRCTATGRPMEAADCCKFAFNILCSKEHGFYYLSKHGRMGTIFPIRFTFVCWAIRINGHVSIVASSLLVKKNKLSLSSI